MVPGKTKRRDRFLVQIQRALYGENGWKTTITQFSYYLRTLPSIVSIHNRCFYCADSLNIECFQTSILRSSLLKKFLNVRESEKGMWKIFWLFKIHAGRLREGGYLLTFHQTSNDLKFLEIPTYTLVPIEILLSADLNIPT